MLQRKCSRQAVLSVVREPGLQSQSRSVDDGYGTLRERLRGREREPPVKRDAEGRKLHASNKLGFYERKASDFRPE